MAQRRKRFGKTAAGRVIELLGGQRIAGIAWGRTIHAVIEGIAASHLPLSAVDEIELVPVCAELLLTSQRELSSSRLAEELTRVLRADGEDVLQLTGFPAYVPRHYEEVMQQAAWRLIRDAPNYERIFSGPDAMVTRMDVLMTSVGFSETLVLGGLDDLLRAGRIDPQELRALVVGDLGGLLIPRPDLTDAQNALIDELNMMWTGISLDQVAGIAARAHASSDMSGVIVLALRAERSKTLPELVRLGLVNQLVIDHDAAAGLEQCLAEEAG
jgi:DNA-binding transcriptional regulator LsrR (DeoR family)